MTLACAVLATVVFADAPFPSPDQLPSFEGLPDPFRMADGSRVATLEDWWRRRTEIAAMLEYYEYGHMPPAPDNLRARVDSSQPVFDALGRLERLTLTMGPEEKLAVKCGVFVPENGAPRHPVLLAIEPVWDQSLQPVARRALELGYIFAGFDKHDFDKDDTNRSDGVHPCYPDCDWATLAAWAWGSMRILDYLLTRPDVESNHVALTGHSRAGKTALLAGALDTRFALVAPHCSGEGGAGSHKILNDGAESLGFITSPSRFHYWFHPRLREFVGKEDRLPFDQHFLKALVAPRPLVSLEAQEDRWANPVGSQHIWRATQPVYDFLGAPDRNVFRLRPGGHDWTPDDWGAIFDYCDRFFFDKPLSPAPASASLPLPALPSSFSWQAPQR